MGSAGLLVHLRAADRAMLLAQFDHIFDFLKILDGYLLQVLHEKHLLLVFPDLQKILCSVVGRNQQILHSLVINLNHGASDLILNLLALVVAFVEFIYSLENFFTSHRNYPWVTLIPKHAVAFPRSRLSIGKQAGVKSLPCIFDHLLPE